MSFDMIQRSTSRRINSHSDDAIGSSGNHFVMVQRTD
jgi:hypothetical protein